MSKETRREALSCASAQGAHESTGFGKTREWEAEVARDLSRQVDASGDAN
nr:hypothetical protein [Paraburkholderia sp. BL8N3]